MEESPEGPVGTLRTAAASPLHALRLFQILKILAGKIVVGHAIHNDFKALQYFHPKSLTRDTSHIPPLNRKADCPENATMSLKTLTKKLLNRDIQVATPQMLPGPWLGWGWVGVLLAPRCRLAPESPWTELRAGRSDGKSLARRGPIVSPPVCTAAAPVLCPAVSWGGGVFGRGNVFRCVQKPGWERGKAHRGALRARRVAIWVSCDTLARGEGRSAWQEGGARRVDSGCGRGEGAGLGRPGRYLERGVWRAQSSAARGARSRARGRRERGTPARPARTRRQWRVGRWGARWEGKREALNGFALLSPSRVQAGKSGHSSVEDAQAAMELYKLVEVEWEQHLAQRPPED